MYKTDLHISHFYQLDFACRIGQDEEGVSGGGAEPGRGQVGEGSCKTEKLRCHPTSEDVRTVI